MINFTYSYQTNQSNDFNGTMKRRDFLKTAAVGSGWMIGAGSLLTGCNVGTAPRHNTRPGEKMKLSFEPYELQLRHTFTVASYSRTTTPDVQVEIAYDGWIGYGEASMPPYLGQTVESVCAFLRKVDLEQFTDPFQLEDILTYVDSLSDGDTAAKAAVDIALHDLVGGGIRFRDARGDRLLHGLERGERLVQTQPRHHPQLGECAGFRLLGGR